MIRTTVYLDVREAAAVRRLAAHTGRSQSSIISDAVIEATRSFRERSFQSHGAGRGTGEPIGRDAEALLRKELGE